jgi:hypothetical protein
MSSQFVPDPSISLDDPGFGPGILGATWTLTIVAGLTVGLRLYTRAKITKLLSWDDWIMLVAMILQCFYLAFIHVSCTWGLGRPMQVMMMQLDKLSMVQKWSWISTTFGTSVSVLARISIAILLIRIFGTKIWLKWFLIVFTTLTALNGVLAIIFSWADTKPVQAIWELTTPSERWDPRISGYTAFSLQVFYAFTDLTYVAFPLAIVWRLNMSVRRRIGLMTVMGLSLVTLAAAVLKIAIIVIITWGGPVANGGGANYFQGIVYLTSSIEQAMVIIMGCVPTFQAISKLEFTRLRNVSSSLSSFITKRRKKYGDSTPSTQYSRSGYRDLEMQAQTGATSESKEHLDVVSTREYGQSDNSIAGKPGHIRRTDKYTVTYQQPPQPKESV